MTNTSLETERLLLRPFKMGDEEEVLRFSSHPEVQRYTGDILRTTLKEAKSLITEVWLSDYESFGYGRYAVIDKVTMKIIGFNGIKYLPELKETDLGYRFLPEYWGKGIATESSKAIIEHAFANFPLTKILGFVMPENKASAKVLQKIGFQFSQIAPYPNESKDLEWYTLYKQNYERQ